MALVDFSKPVDESKVYPAIHHFKVISDASIVEEALRASLSAFDVRSPLVKGRSSSGGKYVTYGVSVHFEDRATHLKFDAEIKSVPGVRVLL